MEEKKVYGAMAAEGFCTGDVVEWRRWDSEQSKWSPHYGIIVDIKKKILSNRLISISCIIPIDGNEGEIELFSLSLRLVSRASEQNHTNLSEQ